jgi:hypothetical protein
MITKRFFQHAAVWLVVASFCVPAVVWAQERLVEKDKVKEVKKTEGWDFLLVTGGTFSFSDSRNTIGQLDGSSYALGVNILGGAYFRSGMHELRNDLGINESFSRTPVIDEFIKSNDVLKLESIYLMHLLDWLGPYAALSFQTAIFESFDVRAKESRWRNADGSTRHDGFRLRLTDGFQPFRMKETIGVFAEPYRDPRLNVEIRLGVGGSHVFADHQLAAKNSTDPLINGTIQIIDVTQLKTYHQAGVELAIGVWGELYEKRVSYRLNANFFLPIAYEVVPRPGENGAFALTNIDINAIISFKLFEWLSLDYMLKAVREPRLLDEFQVLNVLLLTASYTFFKPPEPPKPEPVCTCPACPACICPPPEAAAPAPAPTE